MIPVRIYLIITLSFGSTETDRVKSEPCYNVTFYRHSKLIWVCIVCYIEPRIIMRHVIMRLMCHQRIFIYLSPNFLVIWIFI